MDVKHKIKDILNDEAVKTIFYLLIIVAAFTGVLALFAADAKAHTDVTIRYLYYTVSEKGSEAVVREEMVYDGGRVPRIRHYKDTCNCFRLTDKSGNEVTLVVPLELYFLHQEGDKLAVECETRTFEGKSSVNYSIDGFDVEFM